MGTAPIYRLYVDEHGTASLKNLDHPQNRYLSLTGVAVTIDHAREFITPQLNRIKKNVLRDDPDAPSILHLSDIRQKKGPFGKLKDPELRHRFAVEVSRWMRDCECTVITAIIDKKAMTSLTHWRDAHPYHFLAKVLFEKYAQFLNRKHSLGDIMPEARDNSLNAQLQSEFDRMRLEGTGYVSATDFCRRIPVSKLKFMEKHRNIAGLQLCDLFTYTSHCVARNMMDAAFELNPFHIAISRILDEKYDRSASGKIRGYGVKILP